jgi:hypothetical protein
MPSRIAALFLLFLIASAPAQSPVQSSNSSQLPAMKTFKELDFDMTFIYPASYVPVDPKAPAPSTYTSPKSRPANPHCVQTPLAVGTNTPDTSALVFSIIDDACPTILRDAQKLGDFVQTQILRQLKRYGTPTITKGPSLYTFDGRSAAVILANATPDATKAAPKAVTTYAAKVCMFANITAYTFGKVPSHLTAENSVICFDFTTRQRDLLTPMFDLPIVFGDSTPRSMVPAAILR